MFPIVPLRALSAGTADNLSASLVDDRPGGARCYSFQVYAGITITEYEGVITYRLVVHVALVF
jgi:hypothetical protein